MWELIKEFWGSLLGAGLALGVLVTMGYLAVFGSVRVYESRTWLLYLEIFAVFGILVLELERLIRDFLKAWRGAKDERRKGQHP